MRSGCISTGADGAARGDGGAAARNRESRAGYAISPPVPSIAIDLGARKFPRGRKRARGVSASLSRTSSDSLLPTALDLLAAFRPIPVRPIP